MANSAEALEQLTKDKERREARALKFGVETNEMVQDKRKERLERFKGEGGGVDMEAHKQQVASRKERFAIPGQESEKIPKGSLEFTLD